MRGTEQIQAAFDLVLLIGSKPTDVLEKSEMLVLSFGDDDAQLKVRYEIDPSGRIWSCFQASRACSPHPMCVEFVNDVGVIYRRAK